MICLKISLIGAPRLLSVTVENNATMMPSYAHGYLHSYMQSSHAKSIFSKTLQVSPQMDLYTVQCIPMQYTVSMAVRKGCAN